MNVRAPTRDDFAAVLEVLHVADAAIAGDSDWTASDLEAEWAEIDLTRDAWVLELDGVIAGYASYFARGNRLSGDGYVHPDYHRRGIGSEILRVTEARAREDEPSVPAGERVYLQNATLNRDECTERFYRERGYEPVRGFRGMVIDLDAEPSVSVPAGVEIRPYVHPDEARAFHAAHQEAFTDHWESRPWSWEDWQERRLGKATFDPSLWWGAYVDGELAGILVAEHKRDPDQGWVDALGVRAEYRRRGIAQALLETSFAEFWRRGEWKIGLGVDAESPTGATRVYERAGMRVLWHAIVWEKELRGP